MCFRFPIVTHLRAEQSSERPIKICYLLLQSHVFCAFRINLPCRYATTTGRLKLFLMFQFFSIDFRIIIFSISRRLLSFCIGYPICIQICVYSIQLQLEKHTFVALICNFGVLQPTVSTVIILPNYFDEKNTIDWKKSS